MAIIGGSGFDGLPSTDSGTISTYLNAIGFTAIPAGSGGFGRVTGRNGIGFALSLGTGAQLATGLSLASGAVGMAFNMAGGNARILLVDVNGVEFSVNFSANQTTASVSYNPAGTANDITTTFPVPTGTSIYNFYEVRWSPSIIEIALNNNVVYTKVQTAQAAFQTVWPTINSGGSFYYIDDYYLADDANFRGDSYLRKLPLTGTSTITGTVTGAANAHTALGSFDGDTSYVAFNADGQKVLLDLADITDNPAIIHAVILARQARKSDTGSVTESLLLSTASEQVVGGAFSALSLAYSGRRIAIVTDPHDGSPWSKTVINAMQPGIKRGT